MHGAGVIGNKNRTVAGEGKKLLQVGFARAIGGLIFIGDEIDNALIVFNITLGPYKDKVGTGRFNQAIGQLGKSFFWPKPRVGRFCRSGADTD